MTTLAVCAFEVAPADDEAFLAGWGRAGAAATLHRALRADVALRYVAIGRAEQRERADLPFPAHPGLYEPVREHGRTDGAGGVLLIAPFEVPDGDDDGFVAAWEPVLEQLSPRQGHLGTRLLRARGPATFPFLQLTHWSSPLMYARALQAPEVNRASAALPFTGRPALYLPIAS